MKTIKMKGEVIPDSAADVYDYFEADYFSPNLISNQLDEADGDDVTLEINSPGGYIDAGSEIYTMLKEYSGKVTAKITGQACSAASWIALAADHVMMSPTAEMMIHRSQGGAYGDVDDISSTMNAMDEMDKSFVDLYAKRTGKSPEDVYSMMEKTTWMNAKTALDNGFIDEIMFENREPALVNADGSMAINPAMISKIKNLLHKKKSTNDVDKLNQKNEEKSKGQVKKDLSLLLWE